MTETLTLSPLIAWIGALSLLLNFGLSVYSLLVSGSRANKTRLDGHEERIVEHDARLGGIEQSLRFTPGKDDIHGLQLALARMEGQIGVLGQRLAPVAAIAERMQELMIEQSKRQ
ncbi:DUF2730 family protein [Pararhodobacter sp.]|uniref:DUF2730 family protein n=1 Tax=Pararhodobacter sp. TaxID=2127056 RepID=UPI002AFF324A|nr:DUF2730 family protein [Pararhodobacter sp.]